MRGKCGIKLYHHLRSLAIDSTCCLYEYHLVRPSTRQLLSVLRHSRHSHRIPQPSLPLPNTRTIATATAFTSSHRTTTTPAFRSTPTDPLRAARSHPIAPRGPSLPFSLPFAFQLVSLLHHPRVLAGQRPPRRHKVAQVLDVGREALEPKYAEVTVRLARARRARVTLRFAVQRGLAPAFSPWLSLPSLPSTVFPCLILILLFFLLFGDFTHYLVVGI